MKSVYPKEDVCMACRLCEVACIVEHSKSKDILKAFKKEYPRPLTRTRVEERDAVSLSVQCLHCEEADCIEACITGAMHKNEDGVVLVNEEKCIGCWMCVMACPFGAITRDEREGKKASKCDLCPEREIPACVFVCPNRALVFEDKE